MEVTAMMTDPEHLLCTSASASFFFAFSHSIERFPNYVYNLPAVNMQPDNTTAVVQKLQVQPKVTVQAKGEMTKDENKKSLMQSGGKPGVFPNADHICAGGGPRGRG